MTPSAAVGRPRLRGVSHQWAFFGSLVAGVFLGLHAQGELAITCAVVFAGSVAAMFGMSALYHRVMWSPQLRPWVRRLDHATLFGVIAGSYTAFGLLALPAAWRWGVLPIVWAGVAMGIVLKFVWVGAPKWVSAGVAIGLGWVSIVTLPVLARALGVVGVLLVLIGGVLYTAGGIVYARRRPDPRPEVFGYHEVFHALVVCAVAFQYAAAAFFLPWNR